MAVFFLLLGLASMKSRQIRFRIYFAQKSLRRGNWNAALSARAAPWLAGAEMVRAHPWRGVGPGNFASEFVPARIAAEARHHAHLVVPGMENNSFSQAHSDYLEVLAAVGIPAGACIIAAWLLLVLKVISRGRGDPEAAAAGSSLAAGAIAAATWFPFQIVAPAVWLLLLTGASFRFVGPGTAGTRT
jgi:O-antigen ligase